MDPLVLYSACLLGAVGLYLVVRPGVLEGGKGRALRLAGGILGLAVFGHLLTHLVAPPEGEEPVYPNALFVLFTAIAIISAVKMITTPRPVYAALYFVLVVIASAALFLLLEAEFMAFALIIVYAGAILITYMFVLMLAQQSPDPEHPEAQAEYDLNAREPASGAIVGFFLLALLTGMIAGGIRTIPEPSVAQARMNEWSELEALPKRLEEKVAAQLADAAGDVVTGEIAIDRLDISPNGLSASVTYSIAGAARPPLELSLEARPENVQRVGYALIAKFPVSLELAGVILLMAMLGAVILARRQIELTEDEKRAAAGMRRLGHHDEPEPAATGGGA